MRDVDISRGEVIYKSRAIDKGAVFRRGGLGDLLAKCNFLVFFFHSVVPVAIRTYEGTL